MNEYEMTMLFADEMLDVITRLELIGIQAAVIKEDDAVRKQLIMSGMDCAFSLVRDSLKNLQAQAVNQMSKGRTHTDA